MVFPFVGGRYKWKFVRDCCKPPFPLPPPPPRPLAHAYLTHVAPFCSPKWRAWRTKITVPLPLNGVWVRKCKHVQGCQLSRVIQRILHCMSYLTVNIKGFLINSGMPFLSVCFIANSCWLESTTVVFFAQMMSCVVLSQGIQSIKAIIDANRYQLINWYWYAGADPGFFLGGGALVSCSTSTPINHIVFFFAEYQLY